MATVPTFLIVEFQDAAGRVNEVSYRMEVEAEDDGSNMDDVVLSAATIEVELNALTWDHIRATYIKFQTGGGGAAANVAANNQVYAALICEDASTQEKVTVQVPAWDDLIYAQDSNGLITTPLWNTEAAALIDLLKAPESGNALTYHFSQSRGRKLRKKQLG